MFIKKRQFKYSSNGLCPITLFLLSMFLLTSCNQNAFSDDLATAGSKPNPSSRPVDLVEEPDAPTWLEKTAELIGDDRLNYPVTVIHGSAVKDSTNILPDGDTSGAHALNKQLSHDFGVVINVDGMGQFSVYEPELDLSLMQTSDESNGVKARNSTQGFFRSLWHKSPQISVKKFVEKLNKDKKYQSLPLEKKLALLASHVDPIVKYNEAAVALVFSQADSLLPAEKEGVAATDKTSLNVALALEAFSTKRDWAGGVGSGMPFRTFLLTESIKLLHPEFQKNATYNSIYAGLPGEKELKSLFDRIVSTYPEKDQVEIQSKLFKNMTEDSFLHHASGMSRSTFLEFVRLSILADSNNEMKVTPVTLKKVKQSQIESLKLTSNGMLDALEAIDMPIEDLATEEARRHARKWLEFGETIKKGKAHFIDLAYLIGIYGTTGVGKTFIPRVVAGQENSILNFIFINFSNVIDKYVGETGKKLAILEEIIMATKPGTIIILDEIVAALGKSKGEDAGAQIASEVDGWLRVLAERLENTGRMLVYSDSSLGLIRAGLDNTFASDLFTRMGASMVFNPALNNADKLELLAVQLKLQKLPAEEIEKIINYLRGNHALMAKIPSIPREIKGFVRKLRLAITSKDSEASVGDVVKFTLEDHVFRLPPDAFVKEVTSTWGYDSISEAPPHIAKWLREGKDYILLDWAREWRRGLPIKPEQKAAYYAPNFDGFEHLISKEVGALGNSSPEQAEIEKLMAKAASQNSDVEKPATKKSRPSRAKGKAVSGRCQKIANAATSGKKAPKKKAPKKKGGA